VTRESAPQNANAIILFDGVCNLCSAVVRFVIRHDRRNRFRFASLQSANAQRLLAQHKWRGPSLSSVVLITDGRCYDRSRAALEIARRLDAPWPVLYGFVLVPRAVMDWAYDFIGARRYRWFGKRDECWMPDGELGRRFLD
jgi:predicted DCC family thiol-disulfide oxidoreductase YuxK